MIQDISGAVKFSADKLSPQDIDDMVRTNVLQQPFIFDPYRLRKLNISYYDFAGAVHQDGQMVVLDAVANYALLAFKELYQQQFPIAKIRLMNEYKGDDNLSMADNNTSCLNQRSVTGGSSLSIHSYGLAIDVNPIQNPYISFDYDHGTAQYAPIEGAKYANRLEEREGKAKRLGFAEEIKKIFYQNGFNIWGGDWDMPIDYQHFQTSRTLAELLITMDEVDAVEFFKLHVQYLPDQNQELAIYMQNNFYPNLKVSYNDDKAGFMAKAREIVKK